MTGYLLLALLALLIAAPILRETLRRPVDDAARRTAPGATADLSRGATHYRWFGPQDGPVIVCVHGLTTPSYVWHGLAVPLAERGHRVLVYDLYGRGLSDRPTDPQTLDFHVAQLQELLDDQQVTEPFVLFGHSMGGAIATRFAANQPERIRRLVLVTPAGMAVTTDALTRFIIRTPLIGDWLMLAFYPRQHRAYAEAERPLPSSVPGIIDLQQAELNRRGYIPAVLSSMRGVFGSDLESAHRALHRAGTPVLALWGEIDPVIPLSARDTLARWNPDARQEVIPGAGHGVPYNDTEAVMALLPDPL